MTPSSFLLPITPMKDLSASYMNRIAYLALLFLLPAYLSHAMIHNGEMIPPLDLMPAAARENIEILNHPDKYEQPDHILVMGKPGNGKSTVCYQIIKSVNAYHLVCNAQDLFTYYTTSRSNEDKIAQEIEQYVINPIITEAQKKNKARAILLLENFHVLYRNRNTKQIRSVLKALEPTQYAARRPSFLIIAESLPLAQNMQGTNIIRIEPPDLPTRRKLLYYFAVSYRYTCDPEVLEHLAQETENRSIITIKAALQQSTNNPACMAEVRQAKNSHALREREMHKLDDRTATTLMIDDLFPSERTEDNSCCCVIS